MNDERIEAGAGGKEPATMASRREMVAVAAYYRAMQRGFRGGDPLDDWLEAEAEIDQMLDSGRGDEASKQSYEKAMESELHNWDALFAETKARAAKLKAKARREFEAQLESLAADRASFHERLEELRSRSANAWEDLKEGMEKAWQELRKGMDQAAARFK